MVTTGTEPICRPTRTEGTGLKLQAVSNRKLYLQIADQIRDQILSGEATPGQQLPSERDLAVSLGVSRPTVREALIALEVAGMLEVRVGVGAFLKVPANPAQALPEVGHSPIEVMAVRRLLEPEAAAQASQHISAEGRRRLKAAIVALRDETARGDWSNDSDRAFHMTIVENCGNRLLREMISQLWASRSEGIDQQFHRHLAEAPVLRSHILDDHEAICTAILAGEAEQARAAMAAHLTYVEEAMLRVWD
ncbi:GntR family transcriptional regulator [Mesorhizobium sp. Pch-S]|nr:GntR family transcriptional regulator [Mesorhizobium sp. Pch-S]